MNKYLFCMILILFGCQSINDNINNLSKNINNMINPSKEQKFCNVLEKNFKANGNAWDNYLASLTELALLAEYDERSEILEAVSPAFTQNDKNAQKSELALLKGELMNGELNCSHETKNIIIKKIESF